MENSWKIVLLSEGSELANTKTKNTKNKALYIYIPQICYFIEQKGEWIIQNYTLPKQQSKKAQVTMLIIIGLALLLLVLGGVYLSQKLTPSEYFLQEKDPVTAFVKECLASVTQDGLLLLGQQAGYIYLDSFDIAGAQFDPDNAQVLALQKNAQNGVAFGQPSLMPYWYYQKATDLFDQSEMPQLEKVSQYDNSIQDQLERYIAENLPECTDKFTALKKVNLVVLEKASDKAAPVHATVFFGDKDTAVTVNYPLEIVDKEKVETLDSFSITLPVQMKKVYELAKNIVDYESETYFLEKNTQNLIHLYSGLSEEKLPPTYAFAVDKCSNIKFWFYPTVEQQFKEMLQNNIGFFKVANTASPQTKITKQVESDKEARTIQQGILNSFVHKVSDTNYESMYVDFVYQNNYPLYLNLGSKGILEPKNFQINLLFLSLCMMEYRFTYDFSYPLVVSILDQNSKINNMPYLFQFPVKVIVKDNLARVRLSDIVNPQSLQQQQRFNDCSQQDRVSGDISLTVIDQQKQIVNDALVYFQCGPTFLPTYAENGSVTGKEPFADKCYIGKTKDGKLTTKFPLCTGGSIITVKKQGYLERAEKLPDIVTDKGFDSLVTLQSTKPVAVKVQKYLVQPPAIGGVFQPPNNGIVLDENGNIIHCNLQSGISSLNKNEQVLIRFTKLDTENGILNPPPFATYTAGNVTTINLASGDYAVDLLLTRSEAYPGEMTIVKDSESRHIPGTLFESGKRVYYPDKDIKIPAAFTGGNSFNLTITEKDLNTNQLVLTVIDEGKPTIVEHVGAALMHREKCYDLNKAKLQPRFS